MPFDIPDNDVAFDANQSRWMSADIDVLTLGHQHVRVLSGCAVSAQGSPDMTVAVAAGFIQIADGSRVTVASGNVTISTADGTNPRIDLVSVSDSGTKTATAGTAAASPKAPDLPSGHAMLAMVYVPASDTTIGAVQIIDKRILAPQNGWKSYTVTWTSSGTAPAIGNGTVSGGYRLLDERTCLIRISQVMGSTTTYGSANAWNWSLPFAAAAFEQVVPGALEDVGTRRDAMMGVISASGSTIVQSVCANTRTVLAQTAPHAWANTDRLDFTGLYEIAGT